MIPQDESPRVVLACDFHRIYCAMLAGGLDRAGAEVTMVTRDHDIEFGGTPGSSLAFIDRTAPGIDLRLVEGRVRSPRGWRQALALRRELDRGPSRIVHLQGGVVADVRLMLAAHARPGGFALTVHDPVHHPGDNNQLWAPPIEERMRHRAGLIFVHAEALRDELIEASAPKAPIVVVPHASDPGEATPLPDEPAVLFFGRISYYKGLDVLLDAMDAVWQTVPEATLTVAGAGDVEPHPALSDPRVTVRNEHVPEADVAKLLQRSRCLVLPYRQASQSGVGSRAKPYGRPLVVTDMGGLPELVSDGSGLVVPPEDPSRMAEAIVSLLSDRALAERLGAAGVAAAEGATSWDTVAELTLAAYREHLGAA